VAETAVSLGTHAFGPHAPLSRRRLARTCSLRKTEKGRRMRGKTRTEASRIASSRRSKCSLERSICWLDWEKNKQKKGLFYRKYNHYKIKKKYIWKTYREKTFEMKKKVRFSVYLKNNNKSWITNFKRLRILKGKKNWKIIITKYIHWLKIGKNIFKKIFETKTNKKFRKKLLEMKTNKPKL
jgi:hypothetical protein